MTKKIYTLIGSLILVFFPYTAHANPVSYESFTSFPGVGRISNICQLSQGLWYLGFAILFTAAFGMFIYAGFLYTSSGVNAAQVNQAKGIFTNTIIGVILGLSVFIILNIINPGLLTANCEIAAVTGSGSTQTNSEGAGGPGAVLDGSVEAGRSCNACPEDCVSLRSTGVVVADWNGTNGPGRTDLAQRQVAEAAKWVQDQMRADLGYSTPFQITAAYTQCVGHSAGSQHYTGRAIDFDPVEAPNSQVAEYCRRAGFTFVLDEGSHVHCDAR